MLPICLDSFIESVDEVVIVDGGPEGPSNDQTKEIIKSDYSDCKYIDGIFAKNNQWNYWKQIASGYKIASGDVIIISTADRVISGLDYLRDAVNRGKHDRFYCGHLEFWMNVKRLRYENGIAEKQHLLALSQEMIVKIDDSGIVYNEKIKPNDIYFPATRVFHLGWIRPFEQQLNKHIRNIELGNWGEIGSKLISAGKEVLEAWVIHHIIKYPNKDYIDCLFDLPKELEAIEGYSYNQGYKEFMKKYEEKYDEDFYMRLLRICPNELVKFA